MQRIPDGTHHVIVLEVTEQRLVVTPLLNGQPGPAVWEVPAEMGALDDAGSIGSYCDVVIDDGDAIVDPVDVPAARVGRYVAHKGQDAGAKVTLSFHTGGEERLRAQAAGLPPVTRQLNAVAAHADCAWVVVHQGTMTWVFGDFEDLAALVKQHEGDQATQKAADREQQERRKAAGEIDALRRRDKDEWRDHFINPYTFIPLPGLSEADVRARPVGHDRLRGDRYHGWVEVEWTALTPLLMRNDSGDSFARRGDDGPYILPGSSLKGALRSFHETMAGGCLRVFDGDYTPVHRDPPVTPRGDWRLARIEEVDENGRPLSWTNTSEPIYIEASAVHQTVKAAQLSTGTTVSVDPAAIKTKGNREVATSGVGQPTDGNRWVLLITDAGARNKSQPYYLAAGKVAHSVSAPEGGLSRGVWARFLKDVEGAEDVRKARQEGRDPAERHLKSVTWKGKTIGKRRTATTALHPGDVVWMLHGGEDVTRIRLSVLWRSSGSGSMGERVPPALRPCDDMGNLCPTCRLFGAAASKGVGEAGTSEGQGYAGHLRVLDGEPSSGAPVGVKEDLAPLSSPQPSAGQFYLTPPQRGGKAKSKEERPLSHWGSAADRPTPRTMRGRKVYWHGDPAQQEPWRGAKRDHHTPAVAQTVEVLPKDTSFRSRIHFENLTEAELGGLISVLEPSQLLAEFAPPGYAESPVFALRMGGAKPFGLGTVRALIVDLQCHSAASRYMGHGQVEVDRAQVIEQFRAHVPDGVRATWPHLAATLNTGHVDARWLWYPPDQSWDAAGARGFDEGFKFWQRTSGGPGRDSWLLGLPDANQPDQALPITPQPPEGA